MKEKAEPIYGRNWKTGEKRRRTKVGRVILYIITIINIYVFAKYKVFYL